MQEIVIIGGGASGLFTAILLKSKLQDTVKITICERLERVGKKILATGSGKANFTNAQVSPNKYNQPSFVLPHLNQFGYAKTVETFRSLGLDIVELQEGRIYPKSEMASSLLDVLRNKARTLNIEEKCSFEVKKIHVENNHYQVESTKGIKIYADYVVLACGGAASPILGSNGSGYQICKNLKIKLTDIYPGLVGIKTDEASVKGLDGLRTKAQVSLFLKKSKNPIWVKNGEVQFKKDAVSGIVIMEMGSVISRMMLKEKVNVLYFSLDFYPNYTVKELTEVLITRQNELIDYTNQNFLIGLFAKMLAVNIIKRAKVDLSGYVKDLTIKELEKIAKAIKEFTIEYKGLDSFDHAQVSVGGVELSEVVAETLETRKFPGLYICGEILNIDGDCGGYNLQWAWTSAYVVSKALTKRIQTTVC